MVENEQPRSKLRGFKHPNQKISRGKPRGIEPGEIKDRFQPHPSDFLRYFEGPPEPITIVHNSLV